MFSISGDGGGGAVCDSNGNSPPNIYMSVSMYVFAIELFERHHERARQTNTQTKVFLRLHLTYLNKHQQWKLNLFRHSVLLLVAQEHTVQTPFCPLTIKSSKEKQNIFFTFFLNFL